jgi:acetate kinase
MRVLAVNAGSSTLKLSLIGPDDETRVIDAPIGEALGGGQVDADAVGYRIVHGGTRYLGPALIDDEVLAELHELTELAPLHQPPALEALDEVSALLPDLPAVACFDTAFHATIPVAATTYALPADWRDRWPIRRFGFHGLSHAWIARRAGELAGGERRELRIVSCHLGAGASLCAIAGGLSVDTTMGFTPLEGLVMATRSGSVDPGIVLWLADGRLTRRAIAKGLEQQSGLLGLAGNADMREVLALAHDGDERATLALDIYAHRLCGGIAAMVAALGGIDVLAFTGGIGQNAPAIRELAVEGLRFLGLELDDELNRAAAGDADISANGATVRVLVIEAREDLEIARQVRGLLSV